jgi:hypothetical protein
MALRLRYGTPVCYQIEKPPDARRNAVNLATQCSSTIGSSCQKARPCDRSNASIAAPVDGFAWLIIAGSQSAAATSPDRNFRSSASASARACALLSPSPSLVFQCLQGDVSCGHNVVITLTSKGHRQIDARKYSPSGAVGLRPLTSMPMLSTLGHLGGDLLRLRLGWRWDQCEPLENSLSALALGAFDYSCCFGFACARQRLLFLVLPKPSNGLALLARELEADAPCKRQIIDVGVDLSVPSHPDIFVVGDTAAVRDYPGIPDTAPAAKRYAITHATPRIMIRIRKRTTCDRSSIMFTPAPVRARWTPASPSTSCPAPSECRAC